MDFTLNLVDTPFDLFYTLDSGQVFRWTQKENWWYGIVDGGVVKIKQDGYSLTAVSSNETINTQYIRNYFRLEDDLSYILSTITKDPIMKDAAQRFYGLRLIRQDPWECMVSFVIATNSNIPRITKMVSNLCEKFGEPISFEGLNYRLFPTSEKLAEAELSELDACGLGYRSRFVKSVSQTVHEGKMDVSELAIHDYEEAYELLVKRLLGRKFLLGIGPKVADCVLLFSGEKDDAFPIDIWIAKALAKFYPSLLEEGVRTKLESSLTRKTSLTLKDYRSIGNAMRLYFGRYAGYAQQYLYLLARTDTLS